MLLRKLRLVNYGGIYNGMGLNEIEIDFSKCRNRIILIKGDNGTGKSTIMKALKPLPDDNTDFIPGVIATKEIEYFDEKTGIIYQVR
jgi:predicted ATP-binding protein involved in virulence